MMHKYKHAVQIKIDVYYDHFPVVQDYIEKLCDVDHEGIRRVDGLPDTENMEHYYRDTPRMVDWEDHHSILKDPKGFIERVVKETEGEKIADEVQKAIDIILKNDRYIAFEIDEGN